MSSDESESEGGEGSLIQGPIVQINTDGKLIQKLTGGLPEEIFGMASDWLRRRRLEQVAERLEGTAEKLREAGIEDPRRVTLDTISPWLEGASVEEDPALHEMWESLLANAGDPRDKSTPMHRSFVRILKQIEAPEQKVLQALHWIREQRDTDIGRLLRNRASRSGVRYPDNEQIREAISEVGYDSSIAPNQLNLAKVNLSRLGLCSSQQATRILSTDEGEDSPGPLRRFDRVSVHHGWGSSNKEVPMSAEPPEGPPRVHISDFGKAFYEACQPPEADFQAGSAEASE